MTSSNSYITLDEINSNPIYQPPKEWIDDIEKEEQEIKDKFYCNNFDVWSIIYKKKQDMEDEEAHKKTIALIIQKNKDLEQWNKQRREYKFKYVSRCNNKTELATSLRIMGFKTIPAYWDVQMRKNFLNWFIQYKFCKFYPKSLREWEFGGRKPNLNNEEDQYKMEVNIPFEMVNYFDTLGHLYMENYNWNENKNAQWRLKNYWDVSTSIMELGVH